MITSAFIVSVRNLPMMAETGMSMIFFALIACLGFLIPASLVSAELATGWPIRGGVYVWVKEAFGDRYGFLAIWLQWIQNVVWYPTILSFIGATFAFIFNPAMAENKIYLLIVILTVYWVTTYANFHGMKISGHISTICLVAGVLLPAILIISLGVTYLVEGNPLQIDASFTTNNLLPNMSNIRSIALLSGFIYAALGIEMSAVHAEEVHNPERNYPIAIFMAAALLLIVNIFGSLSIAIVISQKEISLVAGLMQAFNIFLDNFAISWLLPIISLLVVIGAIGQISTCIIGPSKGIFTAAKEGYLPHFIQRVNKKGIPTHLLLVQASIVTALSLIFLYMPTVSDSYWILMNLTGLLYLMMYLLMFTAAIRLRQIKPNVHRDYKIPGGNVGMYLIAGIGLITVVCIFFIGFFPPSQFAIENIVFYEVFLVSGVVIMLVIPLLIHHLRKPSWIIQA